MTTRTHPPFRADHVGSFLRPKRLLDAREQKARGEITAEQLRAVEDDAIAEIVRFQEDVGLQSVTDGEFRRTYFHIDFLEQLGGVKTDIPVTIRKPDGSEELAPPVMRVIDKVRHVKDIQRADFEYLQVAGERRPHAEGDDPVADHAALPRRPRRHQPRALSRTSSRSTRTSPTPTATSCARSPPPAAPTCRWTTPTSPTCATTRCARRRARAATIPTSCRTATPSFINRVVAQKPAGMTLAVHLCRGNFKSTWAAQGGYEPVAEALLSEMDVDGYFLEYDDARSGDFTPLRFLPKGKTVVLGLVTTKLGELESKDDAEAAHRRGREVRAARAARACRRSAASRAPCTATTSRSRRSAPSCA